LLHESCQNPKDEYHEKHPQKHLHDTDFFVVLFGDDDLDRFRFLGFLARGHEFARDVSNVMLQLHFKFREVAATRVFFLVRTAFFSTFHSEKTAEDEVSVRIALCTKENVLLGRTPKPYEAFGHQTVPAGQASVSCGIAAATCGESQNESAVFRRVAPFAI
jgi:hypothetical protein